MTISGSPQKEAHDPREESRHILEALFEFVPEAVVVSDEKGCIVRVNGQAVKLFGYSQDELRGQPIETLVPERFRQGHVKHFHDYHQAPRRTSLELCGRHKDGREFLIDVVLNPLDTGQRKLVLSLVRDLTERDAGEALRFHLAALVNSSSDAIIGKTLDGFIASWNKSAERIFGYSPQEAIGKPISMLLPPGGEDVESDILGRLKKGETIVAFDAVRRCKDGRNIDVSVTTSPIFDALGNVVGACKVARGITERKQVEKERAAVTRRSLQLNEELEQKVKARTTELAASNKELESFSYSVSHDLRAPLRTINGFSHALLEDCADRLDDTGKTHLNRIRAATQRMGSLIDDLLNLSRLSRAEMHIKSVDISALACSIAGELQKSQPERQIELRIEDGLKTIADPGLLRVVLENLLTNAWKFTSKRASARIEFGMVNGNGTPAYFVRDDGAGFDPAYADRLFGAFQRLHAMTEFAGTGVGLATVQRIIHRHGGRIWAESAVDRGATFYFTLCETAS